jgi:hypothetical protein
VPLITQTLAGHRRAEAALAQQQAEALAALAALGGELQRQAEQSSGEARRLAQQPACLELVSCGGLPACLPVCLAVCVPA